MKKQMGNLSLAIAVAAFTWSTPLLAADKELHIMNSGGEYGDALDKCVNGPLQQSDGIKVITETPGGYAKMAAQAKSGVIVNTVTDGPTGDMYRQAAEGLVEPIDWKRLDPLPMFDEAKNKNGFGASYYSTIMAWRSDAKAPQNLADFFDTEKFPGKRALPDYPEFVLPFAAMGGGMSIEELPRVLISISPSRRWKRSRRTRSGGSPARSRRSCSRTTRLNMRSPGPAACSAKRASPAPTVRACSTSPGGWWPKAAPTTSATCCTNG